MRNSRNYSFRLSSTTIITSSSRKPTKLEISPDCSAICSAVRPSIGRCSKPSASLQTPQQPQQECSSRSSSRKSPRTWVLTILPNSSRSKRIESITKGCSPSTIPTILDSPSTTTPPLDWENSQNKCVKSWPCRKKSSQRENVRKKKLEI